MIPVLTYCRVTIWNGLALQRNVGVLAAIKKVVWATYFHKASTDSNPQHGLCPTDPDTWCGYNKAIFKNDINEHEHSLPQRHII